MLKTLLWLYNRCSRLIRDRDTFPFIHMQSGARFVHQWPLARDVFIEDVAHNLSKICRYCGSIEGDDVIYSVAEHGVRSSYIEPEKFPLEKLMHDSPEAFIVDVPRPLKYSPFMLPVYKFYEGMADKAVAEAFGLDTSKEAQRACKVADKIMLVTEKRDLFAKDRTMHLNKMDDVAGVRPLPVKIEPWTPAEAKRRFLMRYYELTGAHYFYCHKATFEDELWIRLHLQMEANLRNPSLLYNIQIPS